MRSEDVVIQAPMSYAGSAKRWWKLTKKGPSWLPFVTVPLVLMLIAATWGVVTIWYVFAVWLIFPYRMIRRSQRRARRDNLALRESITDAE